MATYNAFEIIKKDKHSDARVGILHTKKGDIETPFFMPVATKATVKHISSKDLKEMDISAVISNIFVLFFNEENKVIKKLGGIGRFMSYTGINATDSGGFQMHSEHCYIGSNDRGVWFRNPITKEKIFMTPEDNMRLQLDIGADIAMCLDRMPLIEDTRSEIMEAVRRTTLWAERCKKQHDKLQKNIPFANRQLLFGISQGGIHNDLRGLSVRELLKIGFDGYSIGGLALGEQKKDEYRMVRLQRKLIPENKPLYLMGVGHPVEILDAIAMGVDMFDSRFPTMNARRGTLFTSNGKLRILGGKYKNDAMPIDKKCGCFVCKEYTRAYLRYMLLQKEGVGMRLASYHNLYYINNLIREAKEMIRKGRFVDFKNEVKKNYENADKHIITR